MTVAVQNPVRVHIGNGIATSFAYDFQILGGSDLVVTVDGILINSGYSTTGIGNPGGGMVTFTVAPMATAVVVLSRNTTEERTTDYQQAGDFKALTVNRDFDRLWLAIQEWAAELLRAPLSPLGNSPVSLLAGVPGQYLRWNAAGDAIEPAELLDVAGGTALQSALAVTTGAALVGFKADGAGTAVRTVQAKFGDIVTVNDYVTAGDGTIGSPWTGWNTAITWAANTQYQFLDGHYAYVTSPNFALNFLCLRGRQGTVIHHTGSGYAMLIDAGPTISDFAIGVRIDRIRLEGNVSSFGGVYERGCVHSSFNLTFRNIPGVCYQQVFGVLNDYVLEHTALVFGETIIPTTLLGISQRNAVEPGAACLYQIIAENCSGAGVVLNECVNSRFTGGTSEGNGVGFVISPGGTNNTFLNLDLEVNGSSDMICTGAYNTFINCLSTGTVRFEGTRNVVLSGIFNTVLSGGIKNVFKDLSYSANGGSFTDSGTGTLKEGVYNIAAATFDSNIGLPVISTRTGGDSVASTTAVPVTLFSAAATGMYQIYAYVQSGNAANFTASATVLTEAGGSSRIVANNGLLLTLSLSGNSVVATQTSGASAVIVFSYLRIV